MPGHSGDSKTCEACGRRMQWRRAWERNWDAVRYCSDSCRRRKVRPIDVALEKAIVELLEGRSGASVCPSEVARKVGGATWRDLMEPTRRAARRLVTAGEVEITQQGYVVDPSTAKGPIRIRRRRR